MLLNKKTKFSVSETQIKEDIVTPDGDLLLKINIRYPDIKCAKNDPLAKYAKKFYGDISSAFLEFAKKELSKAALSAYKAGVETFLPYSAVMRYVVTLESKDYLSIMLDIAVSDGINPPSVERKTQVWERKYGSKCRHSDFISKKSLKAQVPETDKKLFDYELFVLREGGMEFFIRNSNSYSSVLIKVEETDKK